MAKKTTTDGESTVADETTDRPAESTIVVLPPAPIVRRIRVERGYAGYRTGEQSILPGTYYEDDPALFSLAEYLVANQYGVWAY